MRTVFSVALASTVLLLSSFSAPENAASSEQREAFALTHNGSHTGGNGGTGGSSSRPTKRTAVSEASGGSELVALGLSGSHTGGGGQRRNA